LEATRITSLTTCPRFASAIRPISDRRWDTVGEDRVQTHRVQHQRQASEDSGQRCHDPLRAQALRDVGLEGREKRDRLVSVHGRHCGANRALERCGISIDAADDRHARPTELAHRVVDLVRRRRVEAVGLDVADDTDDFGGDFGIAAAQHCVAERRLTREESSRERLVDDAHPGSAFAIVRSEGAACGQRDAHQPEIALADDPEVGDRPLRQRKNRTAAHAVR
jgi:hypothetical protein